MLVLELLVLTTQRSPFGHHRIVRAYDRIETVRVGALQDRFLLSPARIDGLRHVLGLTGPSEVRCHQWRARRNLCCCLRSLLTLV